MEMRPVRDAGLLDDSFPLPLDRPFTAPDARAAGVSRHRLSWLVQHHYLRQPVKGVYLASQAGDSTSLRVSCLALVLPQDCVVVDRHAAWVHGAPMALAPGEHKLLRPISVFRLSGRARLRAGLADSGERELRPSDITEVGGVPVTTPLRTAWDLGRTRYPETALAGIDGMLRVGVDHGELLDGIGWFARRRWVTTLRAVAPLGDGRAESPPESVLRLRWIEAGLPPPHPQLHVATDLGDTYLDIGNPELMMGAEYDGVEWHSSPAQREHDVERRAAIRRTGYLVEPFVADDVFGRSMRAERRLRQLADETRTRLGERPSAA